MSSVPSTSVSQNRLNTRSISSLRFIRIRPTANAVKKLFRKIKAAPLIRRFNSEYIPYEEWKAIYMAEHPEEAVSCAKEELRRPNTVFDYEFTEIRKRTPVNDSARLERVTPDSTDTLGTYQKTGYKGILDGQISAPGESNPNNTAGEDVEKGLSDNGSASDAVFAKAATATSPNQKSSAKVDSEPHYLNEVVTVPLEETEPDSKSTVGWSGYAFGKDYDLTYY